MNYRNLNFIVTMFILKNIPLEDSNKFINDKWFFSYVTTENDFKQILGKTLKWLNGKIILAEENHFDEIS